MFYKNNYIYNNYFFNIDDRVLFLQKESSDPLAKIKEGFNNVADCAEVVLGDSVSQNPSRVTFANNVIRNPKTKIFQEATETETWIGNIAFCCLGITQPSREISNIDPRLIKNSDGFHGLSQGAQISLPQKRVILWIHKLGAWKM